MASGGATAASVAPMAPESPYRALQRRAKAAGLPANRSAKELERWLSDGDGGGGGGHGISSASASQQPAREVTAAELNGGGRDIHAGHSSVAAAILSATVVASFALTVLLAQNL